MYFKVFIDIVWLGWVLDTIPSSYNDFDQFWNFHLEIKLKSSIIVQDYFVFFQI